MRTSDTGRHSNDESTLLPFRSGRVVDCRERGNSFRALSGRRALFCGCRSSRVRRLTFDGHPLVALLGVVVRLVLRRDTLLGVTVCASRVVRFGRRRWRRILVRCRRFGSGGGLGCRCIVRLGGGIRSRSLLRLGTFFLFSLLLKDDFSQGIVRD